MKLPPLTAFRYFDIAARTESFVRAAEHLRHILANYKLAVVRDQASFSIFTDVADGTFAPTEVSAAPFASMVDDLVSWGEALKSVRESAAEEQAA